MFKVYTFRNSVMIQWLGLSSFIARAQVQSPDGELKSHKPVECQKKKKKRYSLVSFDVYKNIYPIHQQHSQCSEHIYHLPPIFLHILLSSLLPTSPPIPRHNNS